MNCLLKLYDLEKQLIVVFLSILLILFLFPHQAKSQSKANFEVIDIQSDNITLMQGKQGRISENLKYEKQRGFIYGFTKTDDIVQWTIRVPEDGKYQASVKYFSGWAGTEGSIIEISANDIHLYTKVKQPTDTPWMWGLPDRPSFRRDWLNGILPLKKGENTISMRLSQITGEQILQAQKEDQNTAHKWGWPWVKWPRKSFHLYCIELVKPAVYHSLEKKAAKIRSDTQWMRRGKYGLFFHWSPLSYPLEGDRVAHKNYEWGVNLFDVEAFADTVKETGAAWVIFTTTHGPYYFPGPCKTLENLIPGRTTERDLILEIAEALHRLDIRLILYFHPGPGMREDPEWARISGFADQNYEKFNDIQLEMFKEIGLHYGRNVDGWLLDGGEAFAKRNMPFNQLTEALKLGNPDRVVSYHVWLEPNVSPFGDFMSMDLGSAILPPMPDVWFDEGGPFAGLTPQFNFCMESGWVYRQKEKGGFTPPVYSATEYVNYFKYMAEHNWPISINLKITQDVTSKRPFINPESMEIMKKIRMAVRGK